jgi:hypothetical protein
MHNKLSTSSNYLKIQPTTLVMKLSTLLSSALLVAATAAAPRPHHDFAKRGNFSTLAVAAVINSDNSAGAALTAPEEQHFNGVTGSK